MDSSGFGRALIVMGLVVVVLGIVLVAGNRVGLGRLPGDLSFGKGNFRVYAPIATCLVVSVVLTVLANLFLRR
ncbi:MAG: DUF2905 domain-containing protein [Actinobacteria bacterium]|nr:DUF2905 domain-containing protein [Actinomycetota bacterium]MBW3649874.1 DUF2905 domain-containing protein [Actinomycetota bacterium]